MRKTRVFILDDSALMRQLLTEILSSDPALEVIGSAVDPVSGTEKILRLEPDVLTLDVEMPRLDGLSFLEKLMRVHPMPVVMVSSLTERGCQTTLRALELGAVDFVTKPKLDIRTGTMALAREIVEKVKAAAVARVRLRKPAPESASPAPRPSVQAAVPAAPPAPVTRMATNGRNLVAIGASTGGTEALREVLTVLPANFPGVVIVQHMPEAFTAAFAQRLDSLCQMHVKEAEDGDRVEPGRVLIAPGNYQMGLRKNSSGYFVNVYMADRVNHHRPSVDVLFHSCAQVAGRSAVAAILTGMGDDGADGMVAMRKAGARTVAQDEASCVIYGMPREAVERGGAERVAPLDRIAQTLTGFLTN